MAPAAPSPVETKTTDGAFTPKPEGTRGLKEVDAVGTGERALELRFQVRAHSGGEARYIRPGDTLRSGDRVEMFVQLDKAAYVYVMQFFADKTVALLFPKNDSSARLEPGRHRIPGAGKLFELDDSTGEEHIYVVASREPLEGADREVAESVDDVKISGGASAKPREARAKRRPPKRKKPKLLSLENRGSSTMSRVESAPAVSARSDSNGVVVFRFWFKHE